MSSYVKKFKVFYYNDDSLNLNNSNLNFEYIKVNNESDIYINLTDNGMQIYYEDYLDYYLIVKSDKDNNIKTLRKIGSKGELNIGEDVIKDLDRYVGGTHKTLETVNLEKINVAFARDISSPPYLLLVFKHKNSTKEVDADDALLPQIIEYNDEIEIRKYLAENCFDICEGVFCIMNQNNVIRMQCVEGDPKLHSIIEGDEEYLLIYGNPEILADEHMENDNHDLCAI